MQSFASNVMGGNDSSILKPEGYYFWHLVNSIYDSSKSYSSVLGFDSNATNPQLFLQLKASLYTFPQSFHQLPLGVEIHRAFYLQMHVVQIKPNSHHLIVPLENDGLE